VCLLYVCCVCVCARLHLDVLAFVCTHVRVTQLTFFFSVAGFPLSVPSPRFRPLFTGGVIVIIDNPAGFKCTKSTQC
jgi:hypothetical protein